ncbi:carbonate dehydratase [Paramagnetospirillum kuznetsovii]|uniref:carbonic anhydrase n=1 Tax=Paramagnetospirillum kuznetsovii TaxID=2053833 RepID=A0A364P173_9PROT|nr:carbonic anhydrase family protein [Paramagnetospirillum kuznetsovii]RAU23099.1 carbonate dehydratase [Paramagnetospirillum kuznetsovii]
MDRRSFLRHATGAACLCGACGGSIANAVAAEGAHWAYEGHGGPKEWGSLAPEYAACSMGKEQSPIDLTKPVAAIMGDPVPSWRPMPLKVQNNGHTIQVDCAGGGNLALDGKSYDLLQFHFHTPSEHTVDGAAFDMECHFVHKAADGGLAVLGVMIAKGAANPALEAIWQVMPTKGGESVNAPGMLDASMLLPKETLSFRYAGSLTTPPCSEVVQWVVFRQAITASADQIARFAKLFPMNARPVMPLNRRKLLLDVM